MTMKFEFHFTDLAKATFWVLATAVANYFLDVYIGYRAVGFVFLLLVSILGIFLPFTSVVVAATFSALIWNYFFIPPLGTFSIHSPEDAMMLLTYFIIASTSGFLTFQIKKNQRILKEREDKTREAKLFKESEKLHQTLLNCVSHELRTPLTAIMGAATGLQQGLASPPPSAKPLEPPPQRAFGADYPPSFSIFVEEIVSASEKLNHVFENLLDVTRLEAGAVKIKQEWFDLSELVQFVSEQHKRLLANHEIKLQVPSESLYFFGDFDLLAHGLSNLLLNAVNYSPQKSTIILNLKLRDDDLIIEISDQGPGIPKEHIPHIFEKFYRLPGTPTGGLGLGLSITKNLIELQGGKIEVRNNDGAGTTFMVVLPYMTPPIEIQADL